MVLMLGGVAFISCGDEDDETTQNNNQNDSIPNKPNNDDKPLKAYFTASPKKQTEPSMNVVIYPDSVAKDEVVYAWNFGDGIGEVWMDNTEYQNSFVHHYDTYGEYTISLIVRTKNTTDEHKETIKILPAPPTSIQMDTRYEGNVPYTIYLEAGLVYYDVAKWDIKAVYDNATTTEATIEVKNGEVKQFTFNHPGLYYLVLSASGPGVEGFKYMRTDTVNVITPYVSDKANFVATPSLQIEPSMNVNIYPDMVEGDNVTYTWDFGDGTTEVWKGNSEFLQTSVYTYATFGDYTITLTVDNAGKTTTHQETVKIIPAPPISLQQPARYDGLAPYTINLSDGLMYHDVAKWDIKLLENNTTTPEATIEVKAGDMMHYTFNNPGLYLLELSASGPGVEGFKYMRTDTVSVR